MSTCYYPNRAPVSSTDFQVCPLPPGRSFGMCCATQNRTIDDYCQKDARGDYTGLCLGGVPTSLYRNSCSDINWGPDCLQLCTNGVGDYRDENADVPGNMAASDWPVTACGDGSYCCDNSEKATLCCAQGKGFFIDNNTATTNKPASLTTNSPLSTTTNISAVPMSGSKTSAGAIAGGAVGGFVAGAVIAVIAFLVYLRNTDKRRPGDAPAYSLHESRYGDQKVAPGLDPVEAPNEPSAHELSGNEITQKP